MPISNAEDIWLERPDQNRTDSHKVYYGTFISLIRSNTCVNLVGNDVSIDSGRLPNELSAVEARVRTRCSLARAGKARIAAAPGRCNKPCARWPMTRPRRVRIDIV